VKKIILSFMFVCTVTPLLFAQPQPERREGRRWAVHIPGMQPILLPGDLSEQDIVNVMRMAAANIREINNIIAEDSPRGEEIRNIFERAERSYIENGPGSPSHDTELNLGYRNLTRRLWPGDGFQNQPQIHEGVDGRTSIEISSSLYIVH
jgi:hypothetical protein